MDVTLSQKQVFHARVEVKLKQKYAEAPDVYFILGENYVIPLDQTPSGDYA